MRIDEIFLDLVEVALKINKREFEARRRDLLTTRS